MSLDDRKACGSTNRDQRTCWIVGDALANRQVGELAQTIAREIGHAIIGPGHPDDETESKRGNAPLKGTDHTRRLMVSGTGQ